MFHSLSRISEPLPGADQPTASSGPPRDKMSRGSRLVPTGRRRPGVIRIRVLTTATAATPLQPHPRETAMSGTTTTPVAPRRAFLLLRRRPKSLQERSHSTRLIPASRRAASGLIALQTGPRIPWRSLPGHIAHHHPGRKGRCHPNDPPVISVSAAKAPAGSAHPAARRTPSKLAGSLLASARSVWRRSKPILRFRPTTRPHPRRDAKARLRLGDAGDP